MIKSREELGGIIIRCGGDLCCKMRGVLNTVSEGEKLVSSYGEDERKEGPREDGETNWAKNSRL